MKAAAPQPSPPLPKAAAAPLAPVVAETPPIEERDEEKTQERDVGMAASVAERALRPMLPKASVNTGYTDLVGAARNRPVASSPDVGASSRSEGQLDAAPSSAHQQHTLARVVRSTVRAEPTQSLQFKLATELVRDDDEEDERESAVQRKCDPSLAGDAPVPPDDDVNRLQRKDTGEVAPRTAATPSEIHAIARAGLEGASEPLPHLDRIQPLLAPHDLSGVRTVTGGAAVESNMRLGALGYTMGERIAFRSAPDVKLAAHEAAHVVQQRAGVTLSSSAMDRGHNDPYERTADKAAERILNCEPAKELTDSGGSTAPASIAVQRDELTEQSSDKMPTPINMVWGGDAFVVSFGVAEQDGQKTLFVRPRYVGTLPFDAVFVESFSVTTGLGPAPVNAMVEALADGRIRIDLYGDGDQVYTLVDAWTSTDPDELRRGRRHEFSLVLYGKEKAHRTGWVLDPNANQGEKASPIRPPKPFSSASVPVSIGGMSAVDVVLGPYNDKFRLTVHARGVFPKSDEKIQINLGVSALYNGQPRGAVAHEFSFVGSPTLQVLDVGTGGLTLDLNGDGKADLTVSDSINVPADYDGGGPIEYNRNHNIRISGPDFGAQSYYFTVRWGNTITGGYANPREVDKEALSNAQAVYSLGEQKKTGTTFEAVVDAYDLALLSLGNQAAHEKILDPNLVSAWGTLIAKMARVRLEQSGTATNVLQEAANAADTLYGLLAAATKDRAKPELTFSPYSQSETNPYTGEHTSRVITFFNVQTTVTPGAAAKVGASLRKNDVAGALRGYQVLMSGMGRWLATRLGEVKGEQAEMALRAQAIAGRREKIGELEQLKPIPIAAVFHPDQKFKDEPGYVSEVPLALFAWKDENSWKLRDLTNPESNYDFSVHDPNAAEPPVTLFSKLDDIDHFPAGVIHYDVSGKYGGQVRVRDHLTWKKFFSWLGLGLAAVGIGLATFGTGTVAVAGAWILAASGLAGATSAGIDIADKAAHNALSTSTVVLDLAQIVAGIAGVGQLRSGLIAVEATRAAEAGLPWMGAQATKAVAAQRAYFAYFAARATADGVSVLVTSAETIAQLNDIERTNAAPEEKARTKLILLTTLALNGGLYSLSIRGELPKLGADRQLVLHYPVKGGPPVANVGGMEAPTALRFSQKDVSYFTGDKTMNVDELAEAMKKGWQGPGIDVVELPDGTKISLDNRRLLAAQKAGLTEIPVAYHPPNEPFPPDRNPVDPVTKRAAFELEKPIRKLSDGTLVVGGTTGAVVYDKGYRPKTYGEAAMIRSANQGSKFGLYGSAQQPKIRYPKGQGTP